MNSDYAGPPADVPALRPVAPLRAPARRLQQLRLRGPARPRAQARRPVRRRGARRAWRQPEARDDATAGSGRSTRATPIRSSGSTTTSARRSSRATSCSCAARSARISTPRESVGDRRRRRRRPSGRWRTSRSCSTRPARGSRTSAGSRSTSPTSATARPVYRVIGRRLQGRASRSRRLVVSALARPEWLVEIEVTAVIPPAQP